MLLDLSISLLWTFGVPVVITMIAARLHCPSGVTRVGDTRGGNWGCHPSIFSWKPDAQCPQKNFYLRMSTPGGCHPGQSAPPCPPLVMPLYCPAIIAYALVESWLIRERYKEEKQTLKQMVSRFGSIYIANIYHWYISDGHFRYFQFLSSF